MDNSYKPLCSFCIATYKRPEILRETLLKIQKQTYKNFEVIISDNDPEGSSKFVVDEINDSRFKYYCNDTNLGMVKNFNKALSHSTGEYIVMNTDDDPPYNNLLEELVKLTILYPAYGIYYGSYDTIFIEHQSASFYNKKKGKIFCGYTQKHGEVKVYNPDDFGNNFWDLKILPSFLWSTGMIRKNIVNKIGGLPDYGSPHLFDYIYIFLSGIESGGVFINKALGAQIIHKSNHRFKSASDLKLAITNSYKYLEKKVNKVQWQKYRINFENFLGKIWLFDCYLFLVKAFRQDDAKKDELLMVIDGILELDFMKQFKYLYDDKENIKQNKFIRTFIRKIYYRVIK